MAINGKLDIFKIMLGTATFSDCFTQLLPADNTTTGTALFKSFFSHFVTSLTNQKAWKSPTEKYGLTLLDRQGGTSHQVGFNSAAMTIDGTIDGGTYDQLRRLTSVNNTNNSTKIGKDKIIADRVFFFLYAPIDQNIGYLFLERRSGVNLRKPMDEFLQSLLNNNIQKPRLEPFVPKEMIESVAKNGIVSTLTYAHQVTTSVLDDSDTKSNEEEIKIKVSIDLPPSMRGNKTFINKIKDNIGNAFSLTCGKEVPLSLKDFSIKKASGKDNKRSYTMALDDDSLIIQPYVKLEDEVYDLTTGLVNLDKIREISQQLLEYIKNETSVFEKE